MYYTEGIIPILERTIFYNIVVGLSTKESHESLFGLGHNLVSTLNEYSILRWNSMHMHNRYNAYEHTCYVNKTTLKKLSSSFLVSTLLFEVLSLRRHGITAGTHSGKDQRLKTVQSKETHRMTWYNGIDTLFYTLGPATPYSRSHINKITHPAKNLLKKQSVPSVRTI
jgi:hypothetical protein